MRLVTLPSVLRTVSAPVDPPTCCELSCFGTRSEQIRLVIVPPRAVLFGASGPVGGVSEGARIRSMLFRLPDACLSGLGVTNPRILSRLDCRPLLLVSASSSGERDASSALVSAVSSRSLPSDSSDERTEPSGRGRCGARGSFVMDEPLRTVAEGVGSPCAPGMVGAHSVASASLLGRFCTVFCFAFARLSD